MIKRIILQKPFIRVSFLISFLISCSLSSYTQTFGLLHYLNLAIKQSPLLQKQKNNNKIVDLDLERFHAIYKSPKLSLNSSILFAPIVSKDGGKYIPEWVSAGSNHYIGYDLGITNGGQYQALVSANQPLFTNKYFNAQKKKATITKTRNDNRVRLTKAELQQVVTHQYILCIQSQKQRESIKRTIQIIKEQKEQMKLLVKGGNYKLTDLKLLKIELQNSQIEKERFTSEYLANFNALNLLCGIDDTVLYKLQDIHLKLSPHLAYSSLFLPKYQLDSLSVKAEQKLFELQYLPQINAFGDAGLNAAYLPTPNHLGFSVGISLKWNLFDGNQKRIKNEQSQILLENIEIDKKYFENENAIRKNNILRQIKRLDIQTVQLDTLLMNYNQLLNLYKLEMKQGLISVLEIKTLIKDLTVKEQEKTNNLMLKEILINAYNYWNQ